MKKNVQILALITLFLGVLHSCSEEDYQPEQESEIRPRQILEEKETNNTPEPTGKVPNTITAVWNNVVYDQSLFVLRQTNTRTVYEKNPWSDTPIFTFKVYSEDDNFIYIIDESRSVHIALPIHYPGASVAAWIRHSYESPWAEWRQLSYSGNCISDYEAPTIGLNPNSPGWYEQYKNYGKINFRDDRICFGNVLFDYIGAAKFYLDIKDNCDQDLIFSQVPPAGTAITGNQHLNGKIYIRDHSGNETVLEFYDYVRVCN